MKTSSQEYFKRQTTLSEIGLEGQEKLQKAKVLVIGCGGLGSPVAVYLATSGIGNLHLVDFDTVSISNLHRQVFYKVEDVDKPKAAVLAQVIKERAPFTKVSFSTNAVDKSSILELISDFDVVVDGTDNLQIKYLINDACVLSKKPLVYGSLYKFDGYVATFNVLNGEGDYTSNLRDAFPKIATNIPNCEEAGTLNPIVGIIALLQVNEVIKLITKIGKPLLNQLLIYNSLDNSQLKVKIKRNKSLIFKDIFNDSTYLSEQCETQDSSLLITCDELKSRLIDENIKIVSVVNDINATLPFEVDQKIPYTTFNVDDFIPDFKKYYVIVCNKGITSYDVTLKLKEKYPLLSIFSLSEGIDNY
ncbi:HesA/MoeB/ThiF family protein [Lutibacter flavus]|uniref:Adenylyltransferase and sulfurtransferase n=1 Tax=Lutibacter flavus TaxID=691689 RepID=A0A238XAA4_9FLAO|nr:HesA/MoeB/ThiF family protein [Lutibacter flavus]SNR55867.1 adenylyltransferase and sulfurtransferase [Lutibacter flavus]